MPTPGAANEPIFARDDYDEINERYFADILKDRSWRVLPAGWHNPHSEAGEGVQLRPIAPSDAIQYCLDEGAALGELKTSILHLLSRWENKSISWDEATLCPSVSTANLAVLITLKAKGIRTIIFECPAYYATLDQASILDFRILRVAGQLDTDFNIPIEKFIAKLPPEPCAVWMTQPRFGLGTDQNLGCLRNLGTALRRDDIIIFDEAAEQAFPSTLSRLGPLNCEVIRTRGLVKGIGLNGLRAAAILHTPKWRRPFEHALEPSGASLDRFSLHNVAELGGQTPLMAGLLKTASEQVIRLRKKAEVASIGTWLTPTPLTNGYISTFFLNFSGLPGNYWEKRHALLSYCQEQRVPIVLRASIGFPFDENWEAVRINYFTSEENVETSAEILVDAFPILADRLAR